MEKSCRVSLYDTEAAMSAALYQWFTGMKKVISAFLITYIRVIIITILKKQRIYRSSESITHFKKVWQSKNEFIVSSHSDFTGLRSILRPIFYRSIRFPEHHLLCSFNYCASTVIRPFFKIAIHFCTICSGFFESFWQMQQLVVNSSSFFRI